MQEQINRTISFVILFFLSMTEIPLQVEGKKKPVIYNMK